MPAPELNRDTGPSILDTVRRHLRPSAKFTELVLVHRLFAPYLPSCVTSSLSPLYLARLVGCDVGCLRGLVVGLVSGTPKLAGSLMSLLTANGSPWTQPDSSACRGKSSSARRRSFEGGLVRGIIWPVLWTRKSQVPFCSTTRPRVSRIMVSTVTVSAIPFLTSSVGSILRGLSHRKSTFPVRKSMSVLSTPTWRVRDAWIPRAH